MGEETGFFELLLDFGFKQVLTARYPKILYALHLLVGLIIAIWVVFSGFQVSQSQGLIALLLAIVGYFFWVLYVRMALEFLVAIFGTAENIAKVSSAGR